MTIPTTYPGWPKGVDNIHGNDEVLPEFLRSGLNIDVLDSGKLKRRIGSTSRVAATSSHSLWSHQDINVGYYVAGSTMYSMTAAGVSTSVVTGLTVGAKVTFSAVNGDVLWSNNIVSGKIVSGVNGPFGVETPSQKATLAATTGALPAGRYQVTTTFRTSSGEEGGSQVTSDITLSTPGGISISNLPLAISAAVTHRNIYVSAANGEVMYKVASLPVATVTHTITDTATQTATLKTRDTQPMPAGSILAHRYGVVYVATGPVIYHSEHMRFGQCNLRNNFYMFAKPVTVMLAAPEGLYVCADKTYLIVNPGTGDAELKTLFPFGGVEGTGVYLPNNTDVAWFSTRGQVTVVAGQVSLPAEKVFVPGVVTSGATLVREQNGVRQIINVAHESEANSLAFTGD